MTGKTRTKADRASTGMPRLPRRLAVAAAFLALGGCEESPTVQEIPSATDVIVSGAITYQAWTAGSIVAVVYPRGATIGAPGELGLLVMTFPPPVNFVIEVPVNAGPAFAFGFNDTNGNGVADGDEASGCSPGEFTIGEDAVFGRDFILQDGQPFRDCPAPSLPASPALP